MAQEQPKHDPKSAKPGTSTVPPGGAATNRVIRRGPGSKEVIPMAWKLVGMSDGMPVTLLKCVERIEAEAQLERLKGERYYEKLAVYAIDTEVPIPAAAAKARQKAIEEALSKIRARSDRSKAARGKSQASAAGAKKAVRTAKKRAAQPQETVTKRTSITKTAGRAKPAAKLKRKPKPTTKRKAKRSASVGAARKSKSKPGLKAAKKTAKTKKLAKSGSKSKAAKSRKPTRGRK